MLHTTKLATASLYYVFGDWTPVLSLSLLGNEASLFDANGVALESALALHLATDLLHARSVAQVGIVRAGIGLV